MHLECYGRILNDDKYVQKHIVIQNGHVCNVQKENMVCKYRALEKYRFSQGS